MADFFLNELELICFHTSIAIVSLQLNGFNYCDLTQMILSDMNHLSAHREAVLPIAI